MRSVTYYRDNVTGSDDMWDRYDDLIKKLSAYGEEASPAAVSCTDKQKETLFLMYEYKVKEIAKVVDGDTVDVIVDLGFSLFKKERCRVAGIDTPESRTRNKKEKVYGLEAKSYLTGILENAENLTVKTEKDGKYGECSDGCTVTTSKVQLTI